MEDYVFRYPLELDESDKGVYQDPLLEMMRAQLANILNVVVPVSGDKEVRVDSFKLLRDSETIYKIFAPYTHEEDSGGEGSQIRDRAREALQNVKNAGLYEPRIDLIKAQLESLLSVVELEKGGKGTAVDGFRLKSLKDWLVPSACDPIEVFGYAGARCDVDCVFCYNKGNPPSLALGVLKRPASEEWEEMLTRLKWFSPRSGFSLFPALGDTYEVLAHPKIWAVLRQLRHKTPAALKVTTNGRRLNPVTIDRLAALQPLYLYLSLNSASPSRRRKLMKDSKPEVAINALPLLRERGIPYATVIVPWPLDSIPEMLDDLASTVVYADEHDSHVIQINLPGYSKYFSSEKLYDLEEVWSAIVAKVRELREKTSAPIVIMPSMYEENLYEERKNVPKIMGLVKNSPATAAGLARGDVIEAVGGLAVSNRARARHLLALLQEADNASAQVTVRRERCSRDFDVNLRDSSYPYSPNVDRHLGIVMMGTGLRADYLEKLRSITNSHKAKHVLFLSSTLVRPSFEQMLAESPLFASGETTIDIEVPRNRFFGGNVFMGDLLVVQDFIDCIKDYLHKGGARPDLVVIPSSPFNLGQWKRDLTGRVYLDIDREVGIPVELLDCVTIYD